MTAPYTIYFAGELFSLKHLVGNALLADAIHDASKNRYKCITPQDIEQRDNSALSIRDHDLLYLVSCDVGLFHFDGPELDSGTVVEFMVAKMLDIPSVVLRSDFRKVSESSKVPWNLMAVGYPRTATVIMDSMQRYKNKLTSQGLSSSASALETTKELAHEVVDALDKVCATPSVMTPEQRKHVYEWYRVFAGPSFEKLLSKEGVLQFLQNKVSKGLL